MPQAPVYQRPISIGLSPNRVQGARMTSPLLLKSLFLSNGLLFGSIDTADLVMEDAEGAINNIQTIFVDNSTSPSPFLLTFPETQQTIWVPGRTQGYWPVGIGQQCQIQAKCYTPGGTGYFCSVQFLNVPVPPYQWNTLQLGKSFVQTTSNAGDAAMSVTTNGGVAVQGGYELQLAIYGFDIGGTGATAATDVTATLASVVSGWGGTQTPQWDIYVPVLGAGNVNFSRVFNPPLFGVASNNITLSVPAMGAGQTEANATLYWGVV